MDFENRAFFQGGRAFVYTPVASIGRSGLNIIHDGWRGTDWVGMETVVIIFCLCLFGVRISTVDEHWGLKMMNGCI